MMRRFIKDLLQKFTRDQRGAALVEMTLITPFMLTLGAGVFEFSNIIHTRLLIEAGVEDGARYIARCSAVQATCDTQGMNLAANGVVTGGTPRVTGWAVGDVSVTYTSTPAIVNGTKVYRSSTADVFVVQVSTSYSYTGTGLWTFLGFGALTLTVAHEERVLGW